MNEAEALHEMGPKIPMTRLWDGRSPGANSPLSFSMLGKQATAAVSQVASPGLWPDAMQAAGRSLFRSPAESDTTGSSWRVCGRLLERYLTLLRHHLLPAADLRIVDEPHG